VDEIRPFLERQVAAWNRGDLASFVDGYTNDASYIGADGVTLGAPGGRTARRLRAGRITS
jgi:hypothetical protein